MKTFLMFVRLSTVILIQLLLLVGCAGIPLPALPPPEDGTKVRVEVESATVTANSFEVRVRFYEWTDYEGVIQELSDGSTVLVEVFKLPNGRFESFRYDCHTASGLSLSSRYERTMVLYPGNAKGVDWAGGFAHLPKNKDGSVVTNIGPNFNADYQWVGKFDAKLGKVVYVPENGVAHKTCGEVEADDRSLGVMWSITFDKGTLTVVTPDSKVVKKFNPEK